MKYDLQCRKCHSDNTEIFSYVYSSKEYICVRCLDCHAEWVILEINMEYEEREY